MAKYYGDFRDDVKLEAERVHGHLRDMKAGDVPLGEGLRYAAEGAGCAVLWGIATGAGALIGYGAGEVLLWLLA